MNPEELDQDNLAQLRSNLKQYSKYLSISVGISFMILLALFTGYKEIELLSVKVNFIWGSIFGFLAVCVFLIFASGTTNNIADLIDEEYYRKHAEEPDAEDKEKWEEWHQKERHYARIRLSKLNDIMIREAILFNPLSLEEEGSNGSFILLILSIVIPPIVYWVVQYLSITLLFFNKYIPAGDISGVPLSVWIVSGVVSIVVFIIFVYSYGRYILNTSDMYLDCIDLYFDEIISKPRVIIASIALILVILIQIIITIFNWYVTIRFVL